MPKSTYGGRAMVPAFCKTGFFSDMGYLWCGRQITGLNLPDSCNGKQMLAGDGHIKDGTNFGYFSEYIPAYDGDDYVDPMTMLRRYNKEKRALQTDGPFHNMFGEKMMNGRAMLWGTFIDDYEAFSPLTRVVRKAKPLRGVYTNPGKKGTGYGYVDVCFNKYPEHSGTATRKERETIKVPESMKGRSPFYSRARGGDGFGPNPYLQHTVGPEYKMKFPKVWVPVKQFYPSHYPLKPGNKHDGCFNQFPTWVPDPRFPRSFRRPIIYGPRTFQPFPRAKSTRTNSILQQYISKHINGKNCNLIVPVIYAPTLNKK